MAWEEAKYPIMGCSRCLDIIIGRNNFYNRMMIYNEHTKEEDHKRLYHFRDDTQWNIGMKCNEYAYKMLWI